MKNNMVPPTGVSAAPELLPEKFTLREAIAWIAFRDPTHRCRGQPAPALEFGYPRAGTAIPSITIWRNFGCICGFAATIAAVSRGSPSPVSVA